MRDRPLLVMLATGCRVRVDHTRVPTRSWARARRPQRSLGGARVSYLSLQAHPSPGGSLGFSLVGVGFFVFLQGLRANSVDFFEMLDSFAEFSLFSHQHSVASLQFLKAQAQRFLLLAPARGLGTTVAR